MLILVAAIFVFAVVNSVNRELLEKFASFLEKSNGVLLCWVRKIESSFSAP